MLRRTIRERKLYLYRKSLESIELNLQEKKNRLKHSIEEGNPIPSDLRNEELKLRQIVDFDDINSKNRIYDHRDDEYHFAGVKDPKVILTTSRNPSSRLRQFIKELRLLIPNAQRINRGSYVIKDIINLCRSNDVTDVILIHETRGVPDCLVVSHLPHGPTAYFTINDVVLRHDLPEKAATMSEAAPHLIFENFTSKLGCRLMNILKYLFPPPGSTSKRVEVFINKNDHILFRHYLWEEGGKDDTTKNTSTQFNTNTKTTTREELRDIETLEEEKKRKRLSLKEEGPRFTLKPFRIELGTLEMKDLECEWVLRSFINKPKAALTD